LNNSVLNIITLNLKTMQFTFKRPQTSKSVSTFYRDKYKDKSIPKNTTELPQVNTMQDNQAELVKKWEAAA